MKKMQQMMWVAAALLVSASVAAAGPGDQPAPPADQAAQPAPQDGQKGDEKDVEKKKYRAKDERWDLLPGDRQAFRDWRKSVRARLGGAPVADIKVGNPDPGQPTVLHFHGAGVGHENILVWRLARAAQEIGQPIRIISARHRDAAKVLGAIDGEVVVMGHSAGSGMASLVARYAPGKVKSYIGLAPVPRALKPGLPVPSLLIHGTDDDVIDVENTRAGQFFNRSRFVEMPGVDHSLRHRPGAQGSKADHNLTAESDAVARDVVKLVLETVQANTTANPLGNGNGVNHAHTRVRHAAQPRRDRGRVPKRGARHR
jgi:hypothetical protein